MNALRVSPAATVLVRACRTIYCARVPTSPLALVDPLETLRLDPLPSPRQLVSSGRRRLSKVAGVVASLILLFDPERP